MWALRLARKLSVRVALMTVLALVAAFVAPLAEPLIPEGLKDRFDADATLPVLNILAASMLTVTTFSLGVMVQASQSASSLATPRAYRLMMQDSTSQTVLATFVGSFLFSLTAIAMFRAGYYDGTASVVVFGLTVLVITAIIGAILRWIGQLSQLGSMDHVLHLVEEAAKPPLRGVIERPALGGHPAHAGAGPPVDAHPLRAARSGYVQFVDMPALQKLMETHDAHLWLVDQPGGYVIKGDVLAHMSGPGDFAGKVNAAFTLGKTRSLEQDARFGLIVLAEIASRALSPGVNDPGTAIDVAHRLTNLLALCEAPDEGRPSFDRITAPMVRAGDLTEDAFDALIRDARDRPEVLAQVMVGLQRLAQSPWAELADSARRKQRYLLDHARAEIAQPDDRDRLAGSFQKVGWVITHPTRCFTAPATGHVRPEAGA